MMKKLFLSLLAIIIGATLIVLMSRGREKSIYTEGMIDTAWASQTSRAISASRQTAIVNAARIAGPAVVSVSVISVRTVANDFFNPFFGDFWGDFFPKRYFKEKVKSLGSGVLINKDGYIVTNEHVVHDAAEIKVTLTDGRIFDAEVVGTSPRLDLALIKLKEPPKDLYTAVLGNSDSLMIGEWCVAIGNPFGYLMEDPEPTVTAGVVSALHRTILGVKDRMYRDMIQTDAAINPGNSGGPLVNALGQVVGINTFIFTPSGGNIGLGFAIPVNTVKKFINEIVQYGQFRSGNIGITVQSLTEDLRSALDYPLTYGVLVSSVVPGSPSSGKIKEGDVIETVNGRRLFNEGDWEDITYAVVPGEKLHLRVWHEGKEKDIVIQAGEYHEKRVKLPMGITGVEVTPDVAMHEGLKVAHGILVKKVAEGSVAYQLGIQPGDVVVSINGKAIVSAEDFKKAYKFARRRGVLSVEIDRGGMKISRTVIGF